MNNSFRVFLTGAFGAFIGALVALQLNFGFWSGLIGAGIGFVVGYFVYNFNEVAIAVRRAGKKTYPDLLKKTQTIKAWCWRLKENRRVIVGNLIKVVLILAAWVSTGLITHKLFFGNFLFLDWDKFFTSFIAFPTISMVLMITMVDTSKENPSSKFQLSFRWWFDFKFLGLKQGRKINNFTDRNWFGFVFWIASPWLSMMVTLFIAGCIFYGVGAATVSTIKAIIIKPPRLLWLIIKLLFYLIVGSPKFCWHIFRYIHSDVRLLVGTDAAIGALIGYFAGNVLIGALVGGVLSVINYQLVSIRWLKLIPAPIKR